MGKMSFE